MVFKKNIEIIEKTQKCISLKNDKINTIFQPLTSTIKKCIVVKLSKSLNL